MENNRNYIYGAVGLVVLALIVFGSMLFGGGEGGDVDGADTPSSNSTAYIEAPDVQEPADAPSSDTTEPESTDGPRTSPKGLKIPPEAEKLAETAIKTYTQYSYTDPNARSWMDRLEQISTGTYIHSLNDTFGSDASDDNYWEQEVVPAKRETKTEVVRVSLEDGRYDNTPTEMTFVVTYLTSVRSVDYPEWTEPDEEMSQFVTLVKKRGKWLVDDIVPTRIPS